MKTNSFKRIAQSLTGISIAFLGLPDVCRSDMGLGCTLSSVDHTKLRQVVAARLCQSLVYRRNRPPRDTDVQP